MLILAVTGVALASPTEPKTLQLPATRGGHGWGHRCARQRDAPRRGKLGNHDARAAHRGVAEKLVLVPLDVTEQAIVTEEDVRHAPEIFTVRLRQFRGAHCDLLSACEGAPVHDAHVVAYLTNPGVSETRRSRSTSPSRNRDDAHGAVVVNRRPARGSHMGPKG